MADPLFPRGANPNGRGRSANLLLPPATKLGQGYIFTGVCDSVNRGACVVDAGAGHAWLLRGGMHGGWGGGHA